MLASVVAFTDTHLTSIMRDIVNPAYPGQVFNVPWNMYYFLIKSEVICFKSRKRTIDAS